MIAATTSVVMAVRDAASTVAATIESVLAQTDGDLEFIIVDDGSRDRTPEILALYAAADPRLRVIANAEGVGLTRSLIIGCAAARGQFIARQDAGDLSHPRRLELQRACLGQDERLAFVSCWTEFVGPELEPLYVARGSGVATEPAEIIDLAREHGIVDGPTCHPSVILRREAYERAGGYRSQFYFGQDWDLWYRLAARGRFQMVPEVLYTARVTPVSISGRWREAQQQLARLSHAALLARGRGEDDADIIESAAKIRPKREHAGGSRHQGLYFVGEALRHNGDHRARRYLLAAVRERPTYLKAWLRLAQTLFE